MNITLALFGLQRLHLVAIALTLVLVVGCFIAWHFGRHKPKKFDDINVPHGKPPEPPKPST